MLAGTDAGAACGAGGVKASIGSGGDGAAVEGCGNSGDYYAEDVS